MFPAKMSRDSDLRFKDVCRVCLSLPGLLELEITTSLIVKQIYSSNNHLLASYSFKNLNQHSIFKYLHRVAVLFEYYIFNI